MKNNILQQKTLDSLKRHDDYVYSLQYFNDYSLEKMCKREISNVAGLFGFVIKEMKRQSKVEGSGSADFACSAFNAQSPLGEALTGRNFDYMDAPLLVVWTSPKNGYKSVAVDSATFMLFGNKGMREMKQSSKRRLLLAPYCSMDGINEKGLTISVLEIKAKATRQRRGKSPLTTTTAIRIVLDTCATVEEAVKVFGEGDMHDSIFCNYHFFLTDASGKSAVIEYVNNEMRVIWQTEKERSLALTNYFLSDEGDNSKGFGYERKDYILGIQKSKNGTLNTSEVMQVLNNCHLYYTHKRGYKVITLWSAVYNSTENTMTLCAGLNYKKAYVFSAINQGEIREIQMEKAQDVPPFDFPHIDKEMALIHTPIIKEV